MCKFVLYDGDCLSVMEDISDNSVDCVVTDPPFAMAGGVSNGMTAQVDSQFFEHWMTDVCTHLIRITRGSGCMFFWCDWRTVGPLNNALARASKAYRPWVVSQVIIHDREMLGMGSPFRNQCDFIALARNKETKFNDRVSKTTPNIIRNYFYYGKHPHHPAEKSLDVARNLVRWACEEGGTVLDPFCGSGTVAMAALLEQRSAIGIEKDRAFANVARLRFGRHLPAAQVISPLLTRTQPFNSHETVNADINNDGNLEDF